ncbi:metallophosphoesterase family protein [Buttiauxella gaviniae]|uniref:metallophosphoesterase family protein n=1 Tax=Buttiauxella gaviniae TaxID=82990 RepID=UPI003976C553
MDSNVLILRFRDPEETINTISSHISIINELGAVRWGWWKKDSETLTQQEAHFFHNYDLSYVYLINRDLNKLYKATLSRICDTTPSETQLQQVPDYYRESIHKIHMWFVFTKIEQLDDYSSDYDNLFAEAGNPTYLICNNNSPSPQKNRTSSRKNLVKNKLLVLSDLHFGEDFEFCLDNELHQPGQTNDTLTRTLYRDLQELKIQNDIGLLVITGDFTTKGNWSHTQKLNIIAELHNLCSKLGLEKENIIAVPGNHDILRKNESDTESDKSLIYNNVNKLSDNQFEMDFRLFVHQLNGREWDENLSYNDYYHIKNHNVDLDITILNSCKIVPYKGMSEYGCVGIEGIDTIRQLKDEVASNVQRIVFLHHHLLPVYDIEAVDRKPSLSIDSLKILKNALAKNIKVAIHGHQHMFSMAKYNLFDRGREWKERNITVIANGSTSVNKNRRINAERNSYSILSIHSDRIDILVRELMHSECSGVTLLTHTI